MSCLKLGMSAGGEGECVAVVDEEWETFEKEADSDDEKKENRLG